MRQSELSSYVWHFLLPPNLDSSSTVSLCNPADFSSIHAGLGSSQLSYSARRLQFLYSDGPPSYPTARRTAHPGSSLRSGACGGDWCGLQRHQTSDGKIDEFTYWPASYQATDEYYVCQMKSAFLRASGTEIFVLGLFSLSQGGGREAPPTQENKKVHSNHSFWQKKLSVYSKCSAEKRLIESPNARAGGYPPPELGSPIDSSLPLDLR